MQNITAEEVKERLSKGETLHLLDVREDHEHADFNIGGMHYPSGKIMTMQVDDLEDLKEEELILYCRSGNRSGQACLMLDMIGFKNTKNLIGGMLHWQDKFGSQ